MSRIGRTLGELNCRCHVDYENSSGTTGEATQPKIIEFEVGLRRPSRWLCGTRCSGMGPLDMQGGPVEGVTGLDLPGMFHALGRARTHPREAPTAPGTTPAT